jgi:hypothetical protein
MQAVTPHKVNIVTVGECCIQVAVNGQPMVMPVVPETFVYRRAYMQDCFEWVSPRSNTESAWM